MRIPPPLPRQGGFIFLRLGCLGLLVSFGLLIGGGQMVYTALKNQQPVSMTVRDYLAKRPPGEWVHLTGAHCDLAESVTSGFAGSISEVYIPVRAVGEDLDKKVHVLLKTKDPKLVSVMTQLKAAGSSSAALLKVVKDHGDLLSGPREVSGLVEYGIDSDEKTRSKLTNLRLNLSPDFVIVEDGEKPSMTKGLAFLAGGLLLGIFLLRRPAAKLSAAPPPVPNFPPRQFGGPPPLP